MAADVLAARVAPSERSHDRVLRLGCAAVGVDDLLAVVLAHRGREAPELEAAHLLARLDGLLGIAGMDVQALRLAGLPRTAASRLAAALELGRRLAQASRRERSKLATPEAIGALMGPVCAGLVEERLWCLPLDPLSRLIGEPRVVSQGDVDGTDAGPRAFYRIALSARATTAVAVHNHPAGDPTPSAADRVATVRLVQAGRTIDLPLVDHLVIGDGGRFVSIRRHWPDCFR